MKFRLILLLITAICLFPLSASAADESSDAKPDNKSESMDQFVSKLDAIQKKQDDILTALTEIKAELDVVRVRASQHG